MKMNNVNDLFETLEQQQAAMDRIKRFDGGGGGGYDGNMENRLTVLETLLPTLATKADIGDAKTAIESVKAEIHKASGDTHKWMIATVIGLFLGFGGLFLAMSNALKPAPHAPVAQQSPVIINIPPPQAAPSGKNK